MTNADVVEIAGSVETRTCGIRITVVGARAHSLLVQFEDGAAPQSGDEFDHVHLQHDGRASRLGACRYHAHGPGVDALGDGSLVFLDRVYDFRALFESGRVGELAQSVRQLPLLWSRRDAIRPALREYTADLVYDLQVYRALFDDLDRSIAQEPAEARAQVQRVAVEAEYPSFTSFFDDGLRRLEELTQGWSKPEHERHGFYFRKQVWDFILASEILTRTNLKPRGYAGDSTMMRMIYDNVARGPTIFAKFMHLHPMESAAAQAVRDRRALLAARLSSLRRPPGEDARPLRVMSLACGPACELRDIVQHEADLERFEFTFIDQDPDALAQVGEELAAIAARFGRPARAQRVCDSVRTMLRTASLRERWGTHDFLYSMGLFDYLTRPVAKAVLEQCYELLVPGGELIVGNFHKGNPTRVYMDYWMDWSLYYRDEDEFLDLAEHLPGAACELSFEQTGSQMFLHVVKGR